MSSLSQTLFECETVYTMLIDCCRCKAYQCTSFDYLSLVWRLKQFGVLYTKVWWHYIISNWTTDSNVFVALLVRLRARVNV